MKIACFEVMLLWILSERNLIFKQSLNTILLKNNPL